MELEKQSVFCNALGTFVTNQDVLPINGLSYIPDFFTIEEEANLLQIIESQPWMQVIMRRQQFYGTRYYHTTTDRSLLQPSDDPSETAGGEEEKVKEPLCLDLKLLKMVTERLKAEFQADEPNQILVNEYIANTGIGSHFDDDQAFGPVIVTLTLGDPCWMVLKKPQHRANTCPVIEGEVRVFLPSRSALILTGDARYAWRHGITRSRYYFDPVKASVVCRDDAHRRVSLTVRNVLENRKKVSSDAQQWMQEDTQSKNCIH